MRLISIQSRYKLAGLFLGILIIFVNISCQQPSEFSNDQSSQVTLNKPTWVSKEPIVMVGNWDTAPIFRQRKGGNPLWHELDYRKEHTEEAVQKLRDLGVTMAIIHFYKGFGLKAERDQLADAKKLANLCHKYGIRVGVYVGSTVAYETMLLENPSAKDWFAPDYLGRPVRYGGTQTFRRRPYFMHPGYIEYMKKVLRIAIKDLKVDLIHFDNTSLQARRPVMLHPLAKQHFREYLQTHYTQEERKARLGFSDVTYIEPPIYEQPLRTIDDPLFQMWTDFRCSQLANYYQEMAQFIKGLDSTVAIENNPGGLSGRNSMWEMGVDYPRLLQQTDIFWDEGGNEANFTADSILVSKIRTYKMAQILKNKVFTYTGDSKLQMAEAMAYNRQCLGMIGGVLAGYELTEDREKYGFDNPYTWGGNLNGFKLTPDKVNYIRFFRNHFAYYKNEETISDVAVLRTFSTMAFNNGRPYQSTYLVEQSLIQSQIPFDIIFDQQMQDLAKYKVVILPDQEALSNEQLKFLRTYVRDGGGLVATEHTSLYTETRRRRINFGLSDLFQVDPPIWPARAREPEQILDIKTVRRPYGAGRVVYIPEVVPSRPKPPNAPMTARYWQLPKNWNEIISAVKWTAGSDLSIQLDAPKTVTMELVKQEPANRLLLHLINYDESTPVQDGIEARILIPKEQPVNSIRLLSPDGNRNEDLPYSRDEQGVQFTVPGLSTYDLIIIE